MARGRCLGKDKEEVEKICSNVCRVKGCFDALDRKYVSLTNIAFLLH